MTALDQLKQRARLMHIVQFLPLLPAGIAYAIVMLGVNQSNPITVWCAANCWLLLALGGIAFLVISIVGPWMLLRCPFCKFRFSRAAITALAFVGPDPAIKHCPHCGVALSNRLRTT